MAGHQHVVGVDLCLDIAQAPVHVFGERVRGSLGPAAGVVFRPVAGLEPAEVALAWKTGDRREIVTDFVAAACECFQREPVSALPALSADPGG